MGGQLVPQLEHLRPNGILHLTPIAAGETVHDQPSLFGDEQTQRGFRIFVDWTTGLVLTWNPVMENVLQWFDFQGNPMTDGCP
jgi:hypothetical protein